MVKTIKEKVIDALIEQKRLKKEDIDEALSVQKKKGLALDRIFLERGLISEQELLSLLVKELSIPSINLAKYRIDPELKGVIAEKAARQYNVVPISLLGKTLTVATSDPFNIFALDDLKSLTGCEIDVTIATESEISHAIDQFYGSGKEATVQDVSKNIDIGDFEIVDTQADESSEVAVAESDEAPIIRIVDLVIREALKQRASDIHMEPTAEDVRVRYRIDGVLQDILEIPKTNQNAVITRIKIMSRLDITETRIPQDGRFKMRIGAREVDFRVSLLPTTYGQKVVMRILDKSNLAIGLDGLGFSPESLELFQEAISKPFGMVLVTGPTGSGKSTTLYSIISQLNTVDRNIITVEDPVEYQIEGITQVQVRPDIGLNFASGLRAILRQSPDIVMIGEIRDAETADIAIKASLTGQLVFSTLHTNDAAGAMTRLVDMNVEPFLVASSVVMVCAQRLVRRICSKCKTKAELPDEVIKRLGLSASKKHDFAYGKGCEVCHQTGFRGRMGILEIIMIDDVIRDKLIKGVSSDAIKKYAVKEKHMRTLRDDAINKLALGLTTAEEVLRTTIED